MLKKMIQQYLMAKANENGLSLETYVNEILCKYDDIMVTNQYVIKDIFGKSKVDFKVDYKNRSFAIECKNQSVSGSVDQKLPYYIENIRSNNYPGHFVFILKGNGIRNGALEYLKTKQQELDFSIIYYENLQQSLHDLLENGTTQKPLIKVKPIIKWAGGKRSIMDKLLVFFPNKIEKDYHEPFCGGISVACELYNSGKFSKNTTIYLNDTIHQLITLYEVVKEDPDTLIKELSNCQYDISLENFEKNKTKYNSKEHKSKVEIAALFLFLNKTCFNGVYRENKNGEYNVPFCKKTNISLYDNQNLYAMHNFLQNCVLTCKNYSECIINPGDFVYYDPPYYKTFNSYSKNKFEKNDHITLSQICYELKNKGVCIVESNSDSELINELYKNSVINKIPVRRVINSKTSDRKVMSYEVCIQI